MQWITGGSIVSLLFTIVIGLVVWHWLESGDNLTTGIKMTWQDAKVATSCRSVDTTFRFIARKYEDYQQDTLIFAAPGWKHFICPTYANDAERTAEYREQSIKAAYDSLSANGKKALDDWLKLRGLTPAQWGKGESPPKSKIYRE